MAGSSRQFSSLLVWSLWRAFDVRQERGMSRHVSPELVLDYRLLLEGFNGYILSFFEPHWTLLLSHGDTSLMIRVYFIDPASSYFLHIQMTLWSHIKHRCCNFFFPISNCKSRMLMKPWLIISNWFLLWIDSFELVSHLPSNWFTRDSIASDYILLAVLVKETS